LTDPYQEIEEKFKLTRKLLEVILKYRFPVHILTKSALVLRDSDLLGEIDRRAILPEDLRNRLKRGVIINFSVSTLDEKLTKTLEPGAPKPKERFEAMRKCKKRGFLTGISYIPVLPFLSDSDEQLEKIIKTAKKYNADFVFVGALTLFGNKPADCKTLYYKFLDRYNPDLVPKYESLFGSSFQPSEEYQKKLEEKTKRLCEKYGIKNRIVY